jgi:hypothetical protein
MTTIYVTESVVEKEGGITYLSSAYGDGFC